MSGQNFLNTMFYIQARKDALEGERQKREQDALAQMNKDNEARQKSAEAAQAQREEEAHNAGLNAGSAGKPTPAFSDPRLQALAEMGAQRASGIMAEKQRAADEKKQLMALEQAGLMSRAKLEEETHGQSDITRGEYGLEEQRLRNQGMRARAEAKGPSGARDRIAALALRQRILDSERKDYGARQGQLGKGLGYDQDPAIQNEQDAIRKESEALEKELNVPKGTVAAHIATLQSNHAESPSIQDDPRYEKYQNDPSLYK